MAKLSGEGDHDYIPVDDGDRYNVLEPNCHPQTDRLLIVTMHKFLVTTVTALMYSV